MNQDASNVGEDRTPQALSEPASQPPTAQAMYPPGYTPDVAPFVDVNHPSTVFLEVPGAAVPVYVTHVDDGHTALFIGRRKASLSVSGLAPVPLLQGGSNKIKWAESWMGFPTATYQGRTVFSIPKPPVADRVVMACVRIVPLVLGLLPGYFMGMALARWMGTMIKRGDAVAKRRYLPLAIAVSPIIAIALFIGFIALATASD